MELVDVPFHLSGSSIGRRSKLVLLGGFGSLIILLIALGVISASTLRRAALADITQTKEYLSRRRALSEVRAAVLSNSSSLRACLLDPDVSDHQVHAAAATASWRRLKALVEEYRRVGGSAASIGPLESEIVLFQSLMEKTIRMTAAERKASGYVFLAEQITPGRDRLLAEVEILARADQSLLNETVSETAASLRKLQDQLWTAVLLSILLGLAVALLAYRYLVRLERLAEDRYAAAVEAAQRSEQLSHRLLSVQEQERKTLARELHDEVGQALGAMLVDLGQARSELAKNPDEARARLESAVAGGEHTVRIIRDISLLLRPAMLDELGLIPALHWQAREVSRRSGIPVTLRTDNEDLALSEEMRTTVFRVVQEALNNAARHSKAKSVDVGIACRHDQLHMIVTDDGIGFDAELTRGMGLLGMEERVAQLAGTFRVSSIPGQGTTVTVELPIGKEDLG